MSKSSFASTDDLNSDSIRPPSPLLSAFSHSEPKIPFPLRADGAKPSSNASSTLRTFSVISYCISSIGMTLTNKLILSSLSFKMGFFLLVAQNFITLCLLVTFAYMGWIKLKNFNLNDGKNWLPVAFFLCFMLYTGTKSLESLTIPVFTIFKNLTIILIAYGELMLFQTVVTKMMLLSFVGITISAVLAGYNDISFNPVGYIWMFLNCASTAIYVLILRKVTKSVTFNEFDSVYFNCFLSTPFLLILSLSFEDWGSYYQKWVIEADSSNLNYLVFAIVFSGMASFLISYTTVWCIRMTSSTTFSMIGALNKLPVAVIGLIFFNVSATVGNISSIFVGFFSGVLFVYAKEQAKKD